MARKGKKQKAVDRRPEAAGLRLEEDAPEVSRLQPDCVVLTLPIAPASAEPLIDGYQAQHLSRERIHLEAQLSEEQSQALRSLFIGMYADPVQLNNGRYVQTGADVIRYILERVFEKMG